MWRTMIFNKLKVNKNFQVIWKIYEKYLPKDLSPSVKNLHDIIGRIG